MKELQIYIFGGFCGLFAGTAMVLMGYSFIASLIASGAAGGIARIVYEMDKRNG